MFRLRHIRRVAATVPPPNPEPVAVVITDGYEAFADVGEAALVSNDTVALIGYDIEDTTTLETVAFPVLGSCAGLMYFGANAALQSLTFPLLTTSFEFFIVNNPLITAVSLPLLVNATDTGTNFRIDHNASLVNLSLPMFVPVDGIVYNFSHNALSVVSVNSLLARFVANVSFVSGTIVLEGGTNAAPTGQGLLDVATLLARGVAMSTN